MRRVSMFICIALFFWLSSCTPDDDGHKIEPTAGESRETEQVTSEGHATGHTSSESHATGQMANTGNQVEEIINEGYGNYLLVPAGKFIMGDNYDEGNPREKPVHPVYLDTYYIGEYEVTNYDYKKFMGDGGYEKKENWSNGGFRRFSEPMHWNDEVYNGGGIPGNENFPVVGVSWFETASYCSWLSAKTGRVYRLPTEAEWEKAARGGDY